MEHWGVTNSGEVHADAPGMSEGNRHSSNPRAPGNGAVHGRTGAQGGLDPLSGGYNSVAILEPMSCSDHTVDILMPFIFPQEF